ncbi:MAG TPA: glycosyltransferase family 2 protein [Myxococcaceae bacterium]|nr:glycosyltransferase family 2 protein [Myxococcaceae bacterium]
MAQLVFWCAVLLLLHTYFFYPLILIALDSVRQLADNIRFLHQGGDRRREEEGFCPPVSLVVAAYNEEGCIAEKLKNSVTIDYPPTRFQVIIGSDGSTDATDTIVRAFRDRCVWLSKSSRSGKASVLNRCIPAASGEVIVLSDANTSIDPSAVKKLVRHFADPQVGAVCGRLMLYNRSKKDYEESAYWKYESLIKFYEGKHGVVMGANGGLYAIRSRLFAPLHSSTIVDDFVIAMRIIEQGYQVIYDAQAVAYEETTEDYQREFRRRVRIAAGGFQSLSLHPRLWWPFDGFRSFAFWSHKLLRWCAPALMVLALAANLFLLRGGLYRATLAAQLLFYGMAAAGRAQIFRGALRRASSVAYYFVALNIAIIVGFWRFLRGQQQAAWERTPRVAAPRST